VATSVDGQTVRVLTFRVLGWTNRGDHLSLREGWRWRLGALTTPNASPSRPEGHQAWDRVSEFVSFLRPPKRSRTPEALKHIQALEGINTVKEWTTTPVSQRAAGPPASTSVSARTIFSEWANYAVVLRPWFVLSCDCALQSEADCR
jgi:hypothetical protein